MLENKRKPHLNLFSTDLTILIIALETKSQRPTLSGHLVEEPKTEISMPKSVCLEVLKLWHKVLR